MAQTGELLIHLLNHLRLGRQLHILIQIGLMKGTAHQPAVDNVTILPGQITSSGFLLTMEGLPTTCITVGPVPVNTGGSLGVVVVVGLMK